MKRVALFLVGLSISASGLSQSFLIMPDSTNNRLVTFDPFNGSLINSSLFALTPSTTPVHAMQVGNEIWISEQIGDKVSRWDSLGNSLGAVSGGLDNIRGMGLLNNTVYVTNSGTNNGAPGNAVRMFDTSGNSLGSFLTPNAPSPFGILEYQGGMLVSSSSANDDVHKYSLAGAALGTFHNSASLNFGEQMDYATNGDVLVAGFSSNNIVRLDATTGALISSFAAAGARGVHQLGNGNIMWTSGTGVFVFDGLNSTSVYQGVGRYVDLYTAPVPEPASMLIIGTGIALFARRRRQRPG